MTSSTASPPSSSDFPRWFGDYLLLQQLGRGGMGQVLLAKLPALQDIERLCVIKTLRPNLTTDREYIARFVDEARVVVQLAHRNICRVFDVGTVAGTYYLAMDLVPGRDLTGVFAAVRAAGIVVPLDLALFIAIEVVEALDAAHRLIDPVTDLPANLVHRDVSPHNVLLSFDGEVKLIDFGLAQSTLKHERTEPGVVLGKLAYMAPEHARGEPVDRRADLFAVGVVLYELVAGERYWEGFTVEQMWRAVGHGTHLPEKLKQLDRAVQAVLVRALAPRAADRFATGSEMRQALVRTQLSRGVVAGSSELRDWLERLFPGAAVADRRERAALQKLPLPPRERSVEAESSVRIASASGPAAPALDDQPTFPDGALRKPTSSTSSLPSAPVADSGPLITELLARPIRRTNVDDNPAEPTQPVAPPTRRPWLVIAAAAAAVGLVAAAVVIIGDNRPAGRSDAGPVVAVVADTVAAAAVAAPVPPDEAAGGAAVPAVAATVVPAVAATAELAIPEPPAPEPVKAGKRPGPTAPTAPRVPTLPLPAELPRLLNKKLELLAERCTRLTCTAPLVRRHKSFSTLSPLEASALVQQVDACLHACR